MNRSIKMGWWVYSQQSMNERATKKYDEWVDEWMNRENNTECEILHATNPTKGETTIPTNELKILIWNGMGGFTWVIISFIALWYKRESI